ncbi:MAG: hypothetical protein M0Z41_20640 [Peptococcaceae bacterium]|jgi:hypothetical protein|nr:hypothetical protein [Peptococcaceae bacterium]
MTGLVATGLKAFCAMTKKKGAKPMNLIKYKAIDAIKQLPDGCSIEDIMYQIYFVSQVLEGLKDAEAGRVLTSEAVLEQIEKW